MNLKPHQAALVQEWQSNLNPLLLAGCVGSGKTAAAVLLNEARRQRFPSYSPTLIVCPAGKKLDWQAEIKLWCGKEALIIDGNKDKRLAQLEQVDNFEYIVTNYETVRGHWQWFQSHLWYHIILDEGHKIKGHTNLVTHAAKVGDAVSRMILTGTPIKNKPGDLWSLLHFLEPGYAYLARKRKGSRIPEGMKLRDWGTWGSYWDFIGRYCILNRWHGVERANPGTAGELAKRLERIMVVWSREDVLSDLPKATTHSVKIQLTGEQNKVYQGLKQGFLPWLAKQKQIALLAQLTYFRRITTLSPYAFEGPEYAQTSSSSKESAKYEWIKDFIEYEIDEDEKVVIMTNWADVADELGKELDAVIIKGSMSTKQRHQAELDFKKVLIGTPAAWEGINLQSAHYMVIIDLPWNSTDIVQMIGRIHRLGQETDCEVYILLAENTIDEYMLDVVQGKEEDIRRILGHPEELIRDIQKII